MSEVLAQLEKKGGGGTLKKESHTFTGTINTQNTYTVNGKLRVVVVYQSENNAWTPRGVLVDGDIPADYAYQYVIMADTFTDNSITVRGAYSYSATYQVVLYYE